MINKIILTIIVFTSVRAFSQEQITTDSTKFNRFLVSVHYTGNIRNENFVSDNYNGLLGLNVQYVISKSKKVSIQAGISLDYLKARQLEAQLGHLNNSLMINPNVGVELQFNKTFKPFLNLGYSLFSYKFETNALDFYQIYQPDPVFNPPKEIIFNYRSLSINPGARICINKNAFFQFDYKYLPIDSNLNIHLASIGFGVEF